MAKDGERRMLFDTRGRRKNVIRVVYAVLALLMGTSLFFVVGPVNIGELLGNSVSTSSAKIFREQAEQIERQLEEEPDNEQLLGALTRARINAGNALIDVATGEEARETPPDARDEYDRAQEAWESYLEKTGGEPTYGIALVVAGTFFRLAEAPSTFRAIEENVAVAAEAQRLVAAQRPSVSSLSTLAYYEYFNGNFKAGEAAKRRAVKEARSKAEAEGVESQLAELRKNAKQFDQQRRQLSQAEKEAPASEGGNPFAPGGGLTE